MQEIIEEVVKIPNQYLCPISTQLMQDPVIAGDGISYERKFIETWFGRSANSPYTGLRLPHKSLIPNILLRQAIQTFKDSLPIIMREKQIAIDLQYAIKAKQSQIDNYIIKMKCAEKTNATKLAETQKELHKKSTELSQAKKTIQELYLYINQITLQKQTIQNQNFRLSSQIQMKRQRKQDQKRLNLKQQSSDNITSWIYNLFNKRVGHGLQKTPMTYDFSKGIKENLNVELGFKYLINVQCQSQSQNAQRPLKRNFLVVFSLTSGNSRNKLLIYNLGKCLEVKLIVENFVKNCPSSLMAFCRMVEKYLNKKVKQYPLQYEAYLIDNAINREQHFQIPQGLIDLSK